MPSNNHKSVASVVGHPILLAVSVVLLALYVAPAPSVVRMLRALVGFYLVLVVLDIALTKYHLWAFVHTKPQPKRYALVTGASSGIGREIAFELARQGYSLILASRTLANLELVRGDIAQLNGAVEVLVCACDLSTSAGIAKLVAFVTDAQLVVDILVNNAGASLSKNFVDLSAEQVREILTLDVLSVVQLTHAIAPQMVARGVGRILNIASTASAVCIPGSPLYGSSKAFMFNWSQAITYELRATGVTVTCFCPGAVDTNFGAAAGTEKAMYLAVGPVLDATTCAKRALVAMFNGDGYAHDTVGSYYTTTMMRGIIPPRLGLLLGAMSWSPASKIWANVRR